MQPSTSSTPSTSGLNQTGMGNSTTSTPKVQPMYRLSSFRSSSTSNAQTILGATSYNSGIDSPTGASPETPPLLTDSDAMRTSGSILNQHMFNRQNSQSNQTSPPSSSIMTNVPTYETIDVQNLSNHPISGYNPANSTLDYCSSSGGSGQSQASGCGMDQSSTAPIVDPQSLYPCGPIIHMSRCGPGYLSRNQAMFRYPHPTSDGSAYYSIYDGDTAGINGAYGRSSESGIYSPTRIRAANKRNCDQYNPHHHHHRNYEKSEDFDFVNAIFALISLTIYLISIGASIALAYFFYRHENDQRMSAFTLATTIIPSIIANILSLKWLLSDNHHQQKDENYPAKRPQVGPCGWTLRILLHIVLLGPALRYVDLLRFGVKSWNEKQQIIQRKTKGIYWPSTTLPSLSTTLPRARYMNGDGLPRFETPQVKNHVDKDDIDYYLLTVYEDRDSSLLSLFRSLLQCSVQLVLQLYSLLQHYQLEHVHKHVLSNEYNHRYTEYVQIAVIVCSLIELSWSIASYHRSLRRASMDKRNMSAIGVLLQFIWHAGTIGSRLMAVAMFITQYGAWLAPISIGHWGVMTIWIMHQGTQFMNEPHHCSEYLFNMLVGTIYMIQFLNVKDEPTRYKYLWYYVITGVENVTLIILWSTRATENVEFNLHWLRLPPILIIIVFALFMIGIIAMQLYYWFAHPNGRPLWNNKAARCC
ncbi:hypothetical protein RDWZM_009781 [Blomia tropicalis]|uniref:XK-related protein n=1 Tax=Blomia tropicalis TaxID=40697 RepID=A0A9Q0M440_BLOTA|nr:hypothetical protein RDWZM_009781 [Blomia tropicalis]